MGRIARRTRLITSVLAVLLGVGHPGSAWAYQTYGVTIGNRMVTVKWSALPVRYYVTDRGTTNVTSAQFRDAAARAFASWQSIKTAAVSSTFVGFTSAEPGDEDGQTTLGFQNRPDLDRVLGATSFLIDTSAGTIVEADIFFNTAFPWSVASSGESGRFDLESIIFHETGHLFGLGHSDLGETELQSGGGRRVIAAEAVMFPIAFSPGIITDRTPKADDIAGLSELYPASGFNRASGSISGHVLKGGQGVIGAHVVAFNVETKTLVGGFSLNASGAFTISSLAPGTYILRVEPIDDADLDSFFDAPDIPLVDVGFRVAYHQGLVAVPAGGGSRGADITVVAK